MSAFLPDEPIDNANRFGFGVYSKALCSLIKNPELETPFTIAIHGDWGSGKTSLMKTVCKEIENVKQNGIRVKTIWFDAWEFEKISVSLWKILLNRITVELEEMVNDSPLKNKIKNIGEGLLLLSSDILLKKSLGISLEELKKKVGEEINTIDSLREDLSEYIKKALSKDELGRKRIVIFIDDLDRCLPEHCIEVFESIKLFLNSKGCIFIIGINKEQICKAFENKFGEGWGSGLNYMEKFIQLQFDLPRKNPAEIQSFLTDSATKQLKGSSKTIELISRFIEPNPRKVKRWLNSVIFLETLFEIRQENHFVISNTDLSLVSIWLFLKSFFPDFAALIEKNPSLLNVAIRVANEKGTDEDKKELADYVMEKRLEDFFLTLNRDYDENQLKDVVYLSKLTPVGQVSTLPSENIERIMNLPLDELYDQIDRLNSFGLSILVNKLFERLQSIEDWVNYNEKFANFETVDYIIKHMEDSSQKGELFERILELVDRSKFAFRYFSSKLPKYTSWQPIRDLIIKKRYMDGIITLFGKSDTFDCAGHYSSILESYQDCLNMGQIQTIVRKSLENDQIYASFSAKDKLRALFTKHEKWIIIQEKEKIKSRMEIDLPI